MDSDKQDKNSKTLGQKLEIYQESYLSFKAM